MAERRAPPASLYGGRATTGLSRPPVSIGIDGGATKTHIVARDRDAILVADLTLEGCSYTVLGAASLRATLARFRNATRAALRSAQDAVWAIGLPGYGDTPQRTAQIERAVTAAFGSERYRLYNDVELAHAGALGGEPGVVVASGTGSIALALDERGDRARAGGLGPVVGDEGSSYAIGIAALRHLDQVSGGGLPRGRLADDLLASLHAERPDDGARSLLAAGAERRIEVAALARTVDRAAEAGDPAAAEILVTAGRDLAALAQAAARSLGMGRSTKLSYTGGTFASRNVRDAFTDALHGAGFAQVEAPVAGAAEGGVMLARARAG